jgi:dCMP deaminase
MDRWQEYFMDLAIRSSKMSYCKRLQVGAIAVKNDRPVCSGWNGLPGGGDNCCEEVDENADDGSGLRTKPEVNHAERNLIEYAAAEGISLRDTDLYITHGPCLECAKSIRNVGFKNVYYLKSYKSLDGIDHLNKYGVNVKQLKK